jgi:hypothetical protein
MVLFTIRQSWKQYFPSIIAYERLHLTV